MSAISPPATLPAGPRSARRLLVRPDSERRENQEVRPANWAPRQKPAPSASPLQISRSRISRSSHCVVTEATSSRQGFSSNYFRGDFQKVEDHLRSTNYGLSSSLSLEKGIVPVLRRRKRAWYNEARVQGSRVAGTPGLRADARLAMGPISGFGWEARFSISHASCPRPSTKYP